jgi:2-haloacid dehalogenase
MDRWATFDCYGTLIDWNAGIRGTLARLWPDVDAHRLLRSYHRIEPVVQEGADISYRLVLRRALQLLAEQEILVLDPADGGALADSLPGWPPFPEVPGALQELQREGWRLAILSNTDPDLLTASLERLDVQPDLTVTAAEAHSYKPAHGHWELFRNRAKASPHAHVHVAASLFHDIAPCAELGIPAVWINRLGERSDLPRAADLADLSELPATLDRLIPSSG